MPGFVRGELALWRRTGRWASARSAGGAPFENLVHEARCLGRARSLQDDVRTRILGMRTEGAAPRTIARTLTEDGIPTGHGACRWHPETVRQIILGTS